MENKTIGLLDYWTIGQNYWTIGPIQSCIMENKTIGLAKQGSMAGSQDQRAVACERTETANRSRVTRQKSQPAGIFCLSTISVCMSCVHDICVHLLCSDGKGPRLMSCCGSEGRRRQKDFQVFGYELLSCFWIGIGNP